jgi:hypothetical protein
MMKKALWIVCLLAAAVLSEPRMAAAVQLPIGLDLSRIQFVGTVSNLQLIAKTMPAQAFYGKHIVMPVEVLQTNGTAQINPAGLQINLVYALFDISSSQIGQSVSVPVTNLDPNPYKPNVLVGSAFVPRQDFSVIRNGGSIVYHFELTQNGQSLFTTQTYRTTFVNQDQQQFQLGTAINSAPLPDTDLTDVETTFNFPSNAFSQPTVLTVQGQDPDSIPTLQGQAPVLAYSLITSAGTTPSSQATLSWNPSVAGISGMFATQLNSPYQIIMSYPANPDGSVPIDINGHTTNASNLAPYFYDPSKGWVPAARPSLDTTLHTITFTATTLQTYALFATGPLSATAIRPMQRIITINGAPQNASITFQGLAAGESVHIFDIRGRRVATLNGPNPVWAAKDDSGRTVESGIYIYQYTSQGTLVSGVINVVK